MVDIDKKDRGRRGRDFCCCKDEMADLLRSLDRGSCNEVEIILTSGSECCSIIGTICDIRKNDCILVLCGTEENNCSSRKQGPPFQKRRGKCFISIDKIAAVCEICPGGFPPSTVQNSTE